MSELKPCPNALCGSEYVNVLNYGMAPRKRYFVQCAMCGVRTPSYSKLREAKEDWSKRPHENKLKADAVREAAYHVVSADVGYGVKHKSNRDALCEYADKLERGKL